MSVSHALGLDFGVKIRQELFSAHAKGAPDGDSPSTFLAMEELDLSIISLKLDLGSHSSLIHPKGISTKFY